MPDPQTQTFFQKLVEAAKKVPGLRPATVNGQPTTEADMHITVAAHKAGEALRNALGEDRVNQANAAIQNLRSGVQQRFQDHWAPVSLDPADYAKYQPQVLSDYMAAHRPPADIELDENGEIVPPENQKKR